jgi:RNA polymerase sigma factor (TIGR02999 family)
LRGALRGDNSSIEQLFAAVYPSLRRMAKARLRRNSRNTLLDTTELVHESYLRFVKSGQLRLEDRAHFMCYAGRIMRSVVVDTVRERLAKRRGGGGRRVTLNESLAVAQPDSGSEILAVHAALDRLASFDPRLVQVVELRYFAGMTDQQVAEALGIAERTVRRDWEKARLLLAEALA